MTWDLWVLVGLALLGFVAAIVAVIHDLWPKDYDDEWRPFP